MEQKKDQNQQLDLYIPKAEKRSKKAKADTSKVTKGSHMTRRRQQPDSSEENLLPSQIPQSNGTQSIVTQGQQNQLCKTVIRIPFALFITQAFESINIIKVQNSTILVAVQKQADNVTVCAKMPSMDKKLQIQDDRQKMEQNLQKADEISESSEIEPNFIVNFWGKYVYLSNYECQNKVIKKVRKELNSKEYQEIIKFKVKAVNSDLFVYLNIRAEQFITFDYNGLVNQGNTCYMNSYLQTLYHIPAFRNLVYEAQIQDQSKFPATLQDLFFNLANSQKSVSPQALVKSFGWGRKEAAIQQDAQEFSCLFFQALERKLSQSAPKNGYSNKPIHVLFKGELSHYIRCAYVDFRRENLQDFIDLQLPICPTLTQSLNQYTSEVHMEGQNKYRTDEYGEQQAFKGVKISVFPPILMIQLKRFEYSFEQEKNIKILTQLQYEQFFDFSPWSLSQFPQQYQLYAVLVHEGARAQSGHYYNFIKSDDKWYKFNDEIVQQVPRQKVFKYNFGGFNQSIEFDAKEMKVEKKLVESKTTAYMLVYVRCDMKEEIMKENIIYPEWIKNKEKYKIELQEMKKNRKKFFHNIGFIDWDQRLKGESASDIGFLDQNLLSKSKTIIKSIPKATKISDWLFEQKIIDAPLKKEEKKTKNKKGSKVTKNLKNEQLQEQTTDVGIYVYYVTQRQHLTGFTHKINHTMQDLLKIGPDPYIFKTSFQAKKQQYVGIIKKYKVEKNANGIASDMKFFDCIPLPREMTYPQLLKILKSRYESNNEKLQIQGDQKMKPESKFNYYIDDLKSGAINLAEYSGNIPYQIPLKNQLVVCVIEQISANFDNFLDESNFSFSKWYSNKKQTISLLVSEQNNASFTEELQQIHQNLQLSELRRIIHKIIKEKSPQVILVPENIVLKARLKKSSKLMTEAAEPECNVVKDLIKYEQRIQFCLSILTVQSRQSQFQLKFYYQFKDFQFSDPIRIVVNKQEQSAKLVQRIKNHHIVVDYLEKQGLRTDQSEIVLFSKDRKTINDLVNNEGKVIHKGDIQNVLKKQKNCVVVILARNVLEMESEPKIDIKQQDVDPMVYILMHHVSQSMEKVGQPRMFKVDRRMEFLQLKNKILDLIKDEVYGWQNKVIMCNPFKTRIRLYAKDNKKVIELNQFEAEPDLKRLRIQDRTGTKGRNSRKSSLISNDGKQSPSQTVVKQTIQQVTQTMPSARLVMKSAQLSNSKTQQYGITVSQVKNLSQNLQNNMKDQNKSDYQGEQKQEQNEGDQVINQEQITNVSEGFSTIYSVFPKIKLLKMQIIHNQLIKPNIALRLNVDF